MGLSLWWKGEENAMRKKKNLYIMLGVLVVICIAAFAVSRHEEKKEQIKNSGEVVLEISTEDVTALSWTNENGTFSFTKGEDTWSYDEDEAFPVDTEKIDHLLELFQSFTASFVIDDVEDYSQYGLEDPAYTIEITTADGTTSIQLGDFSKMDQQRYFSMGDGKAYLAENDPAEDFDAVLADMILDDSLPSMDTAKTITFSGSQDYTITRNEEGKSICQDDVYFSDDKPLDTDNVDSYLSNLQYLSLGDYVTYNATEEELKTYGLDDPTLTVTLEYTPAKDSEDSSDSASTSSAGKAASSSADTSSSDAGKGSGSEETFVIHLSQNPEELAAYNKAVEEAGDDQDAELPSVTCYARIGDSQIVYTISQDSYDTLTDASYDSLRHQKLFTADFTTATSIDVTLDGQDYTFTPVDTDKASTKNSDSAEDSDEVKWSYKDTEFSVNDLRDNLQEITAASFTQDAAQGQEEISLTVHLDNEDFPTVTLTFYRQNGETCLAQVDGESVALVPRSQVVDLMESVNSVVLSK